jgi:DNA mismatch repair ATPase MutS
MAVAQEVGLTDRIFTRIATHEAASVPRSAFMIDLSQMAAMLRLSTGRCTFSPRRWLCYTCWLTDS